MDVLKIKIAKNSKKIAKKKVYKKRNAGINIKFQYWPASS